MALADLEHSRQLRCGNQHPRRAFMEQQQLRPEAAIQRDGGANARFERALSAVSYTHLDVYKRQALLWHLPVNFRFMAKRGLFEVPFIGGHLRKAGHISVPQEDVYKRQTFNCALPSLSHNAVMRLMLPMTAVDTAIIGARHTTEMR